jgi:hypothetical protein
MPKINNHQLGEFSANLVTLAREIPAQLRCCQVFHCLLLPLPVFPSPTFLLILEQFSSSAIQRLPDGFRVHIFGEI